MPATGHNWVTHDSRAPTCTAPGKPGYRTCSVCGISSLESDYETSGSEAAWEPKAHDIVHVKGVAATEKTPGVVEHYECTVCKAVFADAAGMKPMTKDEIAIPVPEDDSGPDYELGDVDGDGDITAADARSALRASVKLESYAEGSREFLAADVDKDNALTSGDARLILRRSVGIKTDKDWNGGA